ncbi:Periplasmic beta-glucosidase [Tritrichomonas foetus]|uniref:beta-glucosidase n=1 Tax=Tritrichomonas foetus TaxID=1144522 RepID=A0A1J4KJK1_9EUKA|nr:Periplasmic beta-glucosidase [Tritrichomonas foetus]|eukprot:OHT09996.1 Periplasmic beta-glucosidase [Tritrichomonas foetus]
MFALLLFILQRVPIYLDPTQSVNDRIDDLMAQMTLEEKVGQLICCDGRFDFDTVFETQHPGAVFYLFDDDAAAATMKARNSRLKIPMIFGIDAIHGNSFYSGATIFPTQLGISASWDTDLIRQMAEITADEMDHSGPFWTFSPVLCMARDLRWGRLDETFGEDPLLIATFANAMVQGYQSKGVLACAKHYAGYSETVGGLDSSESDLSQRKLRSFFLPPFEKVARNGAASFMSGYVAVDGTPVTVNEWLLTDVLRNEWNFEGFVVSDYNNVGQMITGQKIFDNMEDAAAATVKAGNDMIMQTPDFFNACVNAVKNGKLDEKYVDISCRRILKAKFEAGLFEDDRIADKSKVVIGTEENRQAALKAAEESLVLLKNTGKLPLNEAKIMSVAVIGPNADDPATQLGDWSKGSQGGDLHPRECTVTPLDGIKERFQSGDILYAKGAGIKPDDIQDINAAIEAVEQADVSIVVLGDDLQYSGETKSTATLELMGQQKELLSKVIETGKPFIIVLISSKPLVLPTEAIEAADAIIAQFNPGMLGGTALAKVIFGDICPTGKLTVSWPRHAGQLPLFYNQIKGQHGDHYSDITEAPLYEFGHGLSYTKFRYSLVKTDKTVYKASDTMTITMTIKNTGSYDAAEIVQVYIVDKLTSVTWAQMELKAFQRVELKAGESKQVTITLKMEDCSIVDANGKRFVEPGEFELHVSSSSQTTQSKIKFHIE